MVSLSCAMVFSCCARFLCKREYGSAAKARFAHHCTTNLKAGRTRACAGADHNLGEGNAPQIRRGPQFDPRSSAAQPPFPTSALANLSGTQTKHSDSSGYHSNVHSQARELGAVQVSAHAPSQGAGRRGSSLFLMSSNSFALRCFSAAM